MEISREQIQLLPEEERELVAYVRHLATESRAMTRDKIWSNCYDAYNQVWRTKFSKEHSWIKNLALYMQTMTQLVDTWESTLIQFLFPSDDDWISVEDEEVGKFWQEVLLQNFARTNFISQAHQSILQAAITGDNATFVYAQGPFVYATPIPVNEVAYAPLSSNMAEVSKIMKLRKTEYQLRTSPIGYFNLENLKKIPFWNYQPTHGRTTIDTHNPVLSEKDTALGSGLLLYQAYIHYFKFTTGNKRELVNFVATIEESTGTLIRFDTQGKVDPFVKNTWKPVSAGLFWGKGVIEPNLSPLSYMNTLNTMAMVDRFLRVLGVYTYNITDEYTHMQVLRKKMLLQPGAFIGVGPNNQITPIRKDTGTEGVAEQFLLFMKNEMVETTGAYSSLSGSQEGTPDPTATQAGLRANAATGRAKVVADHWDENYIKPIAYRQLKLIHQNITQTPIIAPNGAVMGYAPIPNMGLIQFWMKNIGWDEETIGKKLSDQKFMNALLRPIEENQIRPTGTNTVSNRLALQSNFNNAIAGAAGTPESQYIDWSQVAQQRLEIYNVKNADKIVQTKEELLQEQILELQQILYAGIDPNTGLPLSNEQRNALMAQLGILVHKQVGQPIPVPQLPQTPQYQIIEQGDGEVAGLLPGGQTQPQSSGGGLQL